MILMYHKVHPNSPSMWWVDVNNFYRQMCELQCRDVVYLDDYDPEDSNQVVITFDGVYKNILSYASPILKKFKYPFEVFITSGFVGKDNSFDASEPHANFATRNDLLELMNAGGRLQWHTCSHQNLRDLNDLTKLKIELTVPNNIRQMDDSGFKWVAYPNGDFNDIVLEEVRKSFLGGVSCHQGDNRKECLNRLTVTNTTTFKKGSIAIIIASYNYGCFLVEAIESALRQTLPVDEIIIANDCSTDNTDDIGRYYADLHPDVIRYFCNDYNMGIVDNFNKAVKLSKSDYVCILGADNRLCSNYIEETSALLDSDDILAIAYTDFALFGERAKIVWDTFEQDYKGDIKADYLLINFPDYNDASKKKLRQGQNFIHGSSLFRKIAFIDVGGYRGKIGEPEDYNLFYRILSSGWSAKRVPLALLEYRQHSTEQANIKVRSAAELNHYKKLNKSLTEKLIEHVELVNEKDAELVKHVKLVNEKDAELAKHVKLVNEKDAELVKHVKLVNEKDAELAKHVKLVNEKDAELSKTINLLQTLYNSRSWKITAPLRFIGYILRSEYHLVQQTLSRFARKMLRILPAPFHIFLRRQYEILHNYKEYILTSPYNSLSTNEIVKHRCAETQSNFLTYPLIEFPSYEHPKIDISVVTYNSQRWVTGFANSIHKLEYPKGKLSIWFVDNSSTDSTLELLHREIKGLREAGFSANIISNPNNGYGAGHNTGIEKGNAPFCLVSNIDLVFEPDSLSHIAEVAVYDQKEAVAWEFRQKPYEHPKYYDPVTGATNWNSHACVLLRREAFEHVGGYDERLFMYGEDVELSYRLRRSGFLLRYCPKSVVWHFCYEKAGSIKPEQYKGSTFANWYIRLKYGRLVDIVAIPVLFMGLLISPSVFDGSKRIAIKNIFKVFLQIPFLLKQRRPSNYYFPFRGFDYDMIREGAFFEFLPISYDKPLVSIITRTYQGRESFLKQSLLSVFQQTYSNIEHIVIEDGGNSYDLLIKNIREREGYTIRYFPQKKIGRSAAGNYGLHVAKGKYCLFLDDDDLLFSDHIEVLIQTLAANEDYVAAYSLSWEVITDNSNIGQGYYEEKNHIIPPTLRQEFDFEKLTVFNFIPIQSILFERALFLTRGGFEEDMDALEDWNLWIRYAWNNKFIHIPKVTSLHRTPYHSNQANSRQSNLDKAYATALKRAKDSIKEMDKMPR